MGRLKSGSKKTSAARRKWMAAKKSSAALAVAGAGESLSCGIHLAGMNPLEIAFAVYLRLFESEEGIDASPHLGEVVTGIAKALKSPEGVSCQKPFMGEEIAFLAYFVLRTDVALCTFFAHMQKSGVKADSFLEFESVVSLYLDTGLWFSYYDMPVLIHFGLIDKRDELHCKDLYGEGIDKVVFKGAPSLLSSKIMLSMVFSNAHHKEVCKFLSENLGAILSNSELSDYFFQSLFSNPHARELEAGLLERCSVQLSAALGSWKRREGFVGACHELVNSHSLPEASISSLKLNPAHLCVLEENLSGLKSIFGDSPALLKKASKFGITPF